MAREKWGSQTGFWLAAIGSAVGLGSIWRFPYAMGGSGGLFLLIYLGAVILFGLPIFMAELAIGKKTKRGPVGAYREIAEGNYGKRMGIFQIITSLVIMSFYSLIGGYCIIYIFKIGGLAGNIIDLAAAQNLFDRISGNFWLSFWGMFVFLAISCATVVVGVKGIEKLNKYLMPALFLILFVLSINSLTLPGAAKGINFLFSFNTESFGIHCILTAIGQACFSLSIGIGVLVLFGSYCSDNNMGILKSSVIVIGADTIVSIMSAIVIFPTFFSFTNTSPSLGGLELAFMALPMVFAKMFCGALVAISFFILLLIAATASAVSLIELPVAYLMDSYGWKRWKASFCVFAVILIGGIPSIYSKSFLKGIDYFASNWMLLGCVLLLCLFLRRYWDKIGISQIIEEETGSTILASIVSFLIRYFVPIVIIALVFSNIF